MKTSTAMPFGKYKHWLLADIPSDYLRWISMNIDLREPLKTAVKSELHCRQRGRSRPSPPASDLTNVAREIIDSGYKKLAISRHPDHGGDVKAMQKLNEARQWLVSQCEKAA